MANIKESEHTQNESDGHFFEADETHAGSRLDVVLADNMVFSRAKIKKMINIDLVTQLRNQKPIEVKPKNIVQEGDIFIVKKIVKSEEIPNIKELFSDDDILVFIKPAGMLVHPKNDLETEVTIEDFLKTKTTEEVTRNGIVHRLDRPTSGVMVAARNQKTYDILKEAFAERTVKKQYLALVEGRFTDEKLNIDLAIGRDGSRGGLYKVRHDGRTAVTKVEKCLPSGTKSFSFLLLKPHSGRTHQLRVHLSHLNFPIAGDRLYGSKKTLKNRILLHSFRLNIPGYKQTFEAPIPNDMTNFLTKYNFGDYNAWLE